MNLPSKEYEINGTTYKVTQLTLRKWLELKSLVFNSFGPAIGTFLSSWSAGQEGETEAVGSLINRLSEDADPNTYEKLIKTLSECSEVKDTRLSEVYEAWWPTHLADIPEFVFFALYVQFSDFLGGIRKVMQGGQTFLSKKD